VIGPAVVIGPAIVSTLRREGTVPAMEQTSSVDPPRRDHEAVAFAAFVGVVALAAVGGARVGPGPSNPRTERWYRRLRRPPFQPPAAVFGPVWTVLYAMIAASGWRIWRLPSNHRRSIALALWGGQMAANAAWTPLFFGARRPGAAMADLVAQLGLTSAYTAAASRLDRGAATLMAPYLVWTAFAGALNEEIVRRN
jgi:tryptophan-rich sensory protein